MTCYCNNCEEWVQGEKSDNPQDESLYCELCTKQVYEYDVQVAFVTELHFNF